MIVFLHGTNVRKLQQKSSTIIQTLRTKKPNASQITFDADLDVSLLESTLTSAGLFEENYIVAIKNITENKDLWKTASKLLKKMEESKHVYVWVEASKETAAIKKIKVHARKTEEHNAEAIEKPDSEVFNFLKIFFAKDAKGAWLWHTTHPHIDMSQLLNIMMWQIKAISLTVNARTPNESGLKPYVFNTSKGLLQKWSPQELAQLYTQCLTWSARGRQGEKNAHQFESYILSLGGK